MTKLKILLLTTITVLFFGCSEEEPETQIIEQELSALGLVPSSLQELNDIELAGYSHPSTGSSSSSLPNFYDLSPYMPPVRSQGQIGSCTSWASGYYLKSYQEKIENGYSYNNDNSKLMSPSFIFNQVRSNPSDCENGGSTIISNLNILKNQGVCSWQSMPYEVTDCNLQPNSGQIQQAEQNKILNYFFMYASYDTYGLSSEDLIRYTKEFVSRDVPMIISIPLDSNFQQATSQNNNYIFENYSQNNHVGYHAVLVVGYDDSKNAFKVVNSWGEDWGNDGYFWFDYDLYSDIVIEVWKTTDIVSNNQCSDFYISRTGYNPGGTGGGYPTTAHFPHAGLVINGGTEPYLYKMIDIDNGNTSSSWQSSNEFTVTTEGRYSFIVKDANGCETTPLTKVFD